jgi:hypothetical protein
MLCEYLIVTELASDKARYLQHQVDCLGQNRARKVTKNGNGHFGSRVRTAGRTCHLGRSLSLEP